MVIKKKIYKLISKFRPGTKFKYEGSDYIETVLGLSPSYNRIFHNWEVLVIGAESRIIYDGNKGRYFFPVKSKSLKYDFLIKRN